MASTLPKDKQTSPRLAGPRNLPPEVVELIPKVNPSVMDQVMALQRQGLSNPYTSQWTDTELFQAVLAFFEFCSKEGIKPTKPGLQIWLYVSKTQMDEWIKNKDGRYSGKSEVMKYAMGVMETFLQLDLDNNPKGAMFLLKTTFGHVDSTKVDVVNHNTVGVTGIEERLQKLALLESKDEEDSE